MDLTSNLPGQFSMQEILRIAASPAGQKLISLMKQQGGSDFQKAMDCAASGDYSQAKRVIESLMTDPKAQQLLKELGR